MRATVNMPPNYTPETPASRLHAVVRAGILRTEETRDAATVGLHGRSPSDSHYLSIVVETRSTAIVEALRGRTLRGLQAGTLRPGDRLPSARELVAEFAVDHRLIVAAYRQMSDEGLVTIRGRGGVYVASTPATIAGLPTLPVNWFVEMFTEAFAHEIAAPELHEWMRRAIETLRLRAAVISTTPDQVAGLARELRDDFGLAADGFTGPGLAGLSPHPASLRRADVIIATHAQRAIATRIADELGKPLVLIEVRPDLVAGDWALLLRQRVWAVVSTGEFADILRDFFADVRGVENLKILVFGRDDLATIPEDAPTYVTQQVRELLAGTPIRGRILPAARTIATDSARALFEFIVRRNVDAMSSVRDGAADAPRRGAVGD